MTLEANRREFLQTLFVGAAGMSLTWPAYGQPRPPAPIMATKLTDRIAIFAGAGGKVGLVIGPADLMMVDGGLANRAKELAQAIAMMNKRRRVEVLFNTHYHSDHVGSNEHLGKDKLQILAHENVKTRPGQRIESTALAARLSRSRRSDCRPRHL